MGDRDAEIGDERPPRPALDQDVLRLHIAVHHAAFMRVGQRPADLAAKAAHIFCRQRAHASQPIGQRFARDVRHDEPREVTRFGHFMNGHDVGVKALGRQTRFPQEPAAHVLAGGQRRRQQLDGHGTFENDVAGEVDDTHAAAAKFAFKGEATGDGGLQGDERRVDGGGAYAVPYARQPGASFFCVRTRGASFP